MSTDLSRLIAGRIDAADGWLRFDRFMALALYAPNRGYYARPDRTPFGAAGDFVTAPELTPLFAQSVAGQCLDWFDQVPARIVEFGAGSGALASGVLAACEAAGRPVESYDIVEVSASLAAAQRERLAREVPQCLPRVRWLAELPDEIEGVVLGNEVLDAMPVRLFVLQDGRVLERGVRRTTLEEAAEALQASLSAPVRAPGAPGAPVSAAPLVAPPLFRFDDRAADADFDRAVREAVAEAGLPLEQAEGYVGEWPEQAEAWVRTVAARIRRGALLLFDYGFPRAELYHPDRRGGTLMTHRRHRAHPDPLVEVGERDITAHVDFSAVARAATDEGMALAGYTSQARFLMNTGLLERLARFPVEDVRAFAPQAAVAQTLLSEAEMGELFKAIALVRGIEGVPAGFGRGDRSVSL